MNIVLLAPEIPPNTGNIGRTCVATNSSLHLIKPLGFSIDDKQLRRAGMDYWKDLDVHYYEDFEDFLAKNQNIRLWLASTKARHVYSEVNYEPDDFIMFGRESKGIPEEILMAFEEGTIRIPMLETERSLNLSNAASIVLYEALRQLGFPGMSKEGELHEHKWADCE